MDKAYWDNFYKNNTNQSTLLDCSSFAIFCQQSFLKSKLNIVELGCGNGRDAKFLAQEHNNVYAIDQSSHLNLIENVPENLHFTQDDFIKCDYNFYDSIDVFYSRFTLHSITSLDQQVLIPKIFDKLESNGLLCIEARTTLDDKFGLGEDCGDNTFYYDNHKRRFIDSQQFLKYTLNVGFNVRYFNECNGISIHGDDDPVLLRLILEKR